jgi:hypothetical protein
MLEFKSVLAVTAKAYYNVHSSLPLGLYDTTVTTL